MKKLIIPGIFALAFACGYSVNAQNEQEPEDKVELIGKALRDRIVLRWAPTSPVAWQLTNRYGYVLERYTIMRDGMILEQPEKILLSSQPIKPWPLEAWEPLTEENDYGAVAAQALYGETFEVTQGEDQDIMQMINKAREVESRFSFALFAADQSMKVAEASGLAFTDGAVKKNEKYLYRVYSPVPEEKLKLDTGFVYLGLQDYLKLPRPTGLEAQFGDKTVSLTWDFRRYLDFYSSYVLERSDDGGKTFYAISDLPLVNAYDENRPVPEKMLKNDVLEENGKKHHYRVRGISPFGEISEPSDTVSGMGFTPLYAHPVISEAKVEDNARVSVSWVFPDSVAHLVQEFELMRAEKADGKYEAIVGGIDADGRTIIDQQPLQTNYYVVAALDKYGNRNLSTPTLAMLVDSIPPIKPVDIIGAIDSLGVVLLSWKPNEEKDLHGYRVFRANYATDEFIQVTKDPVDVPEFRDSINIKTLTENIYYKVVAIDRHYNPSDPSEALELKRPDIIPPVAPVFAKTKASEEGIYLSWVNSSSTDVIRHALYRKSSADKLWALIKTFDAPDPTSEYMDDQVETGIYYEYTLVALDDDHLESPPAKPVMAKKIDSGKRQEIKDVFVKADREKNVIDLAWEYPEQGVKRYLIYRAKEGAPLMLYETVEGREKSFSDGKITTDTNYKYRIQVEHEDGGLSPFSKELSVNF